MLQWKIKGISDTACKLEKDVNFGIIASAMGDCSVSIMNIHRPIIWRYLY